MKKAALLLALLIVTAPAQAQLLKCIGKDGRVEYASQCPDGTTAQKTGIRSNPAASGSKKQPTYAEREADFKKRRAEQAEAQAKQEKEAALLAQKQHACETAKSTLAGLESGVRLVRTDPNTGERVYLDDKERAAEAERARQMVQANCS